MHGVVLQNRESGPLPPPRVNPAHPSRPTATAVSTMRLEKPHSLSYQLSTRTSLPSITWVCLRSKVELAGLWLKSDDTSGWSFVARMPLRGLLLAVAASMMALLTSSTEVGRFGTNLKSIMETLGVGTRMDEPSSLPFSSDRKSPTALAAPVVVGIIESAAARAR